MSASDEETRTGSRRDFLREAGVAAGGAALAGTTQTAAAQGPGKAVPARGRGGVGEFRASGPAETALQKLGPLKELPGTWVGGGFVLISLPDFQDGKAFRVQINATVETLEFTPIGGKIPDRGSGQDDIFLHGVTYLQRISDAVSDGALHIEPGLWLHVPATKVPNNPKETVVRQATIPHGDSLLAQGDVIPEVQGGPIIQAVDSTPTKNPPGPPLGAAYLEPFQNPALPPGFKPPFIKNPNLALEEAILGQTIKKTVVLSVSTTNSGGIVNIPFVVSNANATRMDAIFWIETVVQPDASEFMQLQYTQTVILNFLGIDWPHISVATLVKQ
jgi:hypothetical protein